MQNRPVRNDPTKFPSMVSTEVYAQEIRELKDTISALNDDIDTAKKTIAELTAELENERSENVTMARRFRSYQHNREESDEEYRVEINLLKREIKNLSSQVEGLKRNPGEYHL